jgi:hypothetical protein
MASGATRVNANGTQRTVIITELLATAESIRRRNRFADSLNLFLFVAAITLRRMKHRRYVAVQRPTLCFLAPSFLELPASLPALL